MNVKTLLKFTDCFKSDNKVSLLNTSHFGALVPHIFLRKFCQGRLVRVCKNQKIRIMKQRLATNREQLPVSRPPSSFGPRKYETQPLPGRSEGEVRLSDRRERDPARLARRASRSPSTAAFLQSGHLSFRGENLEGTADGVLKKRI